MKNAGLADLPHELLDHILRYLPSARDIASISLLNRAFHIYIEEEGWSVFTRSKFYWVDQSQSRPWRSTARSLSTVCRAWDRRAFVIRDLEPKADIISHPAGTKSETWQAPTGQTMGFVPKLDVYEKHTDSRASTEVLAFSAGAQMCIRSRLCKYKSHAKTSESIRWSTYRPLAAREGRDDITSLNLLHSTTSRPTQHVIAGTANGDLQHINLPLNVGKSSIVSYFTTQGLPVQSTALWQQDRAGPMLAAALGNTRLALYNVDAGKVKIAPADLHDFKASDENHVAFKSSSCRIWTTQFLSKDRLALGIGSSEYPLIYRQIRPPGIDRVPSRMFRLDEQSRTSSGSNAVYAITPILDNEQAFFTGAYDGLVRMHDLRCPEENVAYFSSPTSDAAVYSILIRGRYTLLAGSCRDEVVHVFDLRYGSSGYRYTNACEVEPARTLDTKWSMYLSGGAGSTRRSNNRRDGSVYSLAASSVDSPNVYLGLQNTVLELAATEVAHRHPDPLHFTPWPSHKKKKLHPHHWNKWTDLEVRNVSLYESGRLILQSDLMQAWTDDKHRAMPRQDGWPIDSRYKQIPGERQRI